MARPVDTPELARKRERETQMVSQMIALWCRGHHGGGHAVEQAGDDESVRVKLGLRTITLCPECAELQKYAIARIGTARTWAPRHFARHVLRIVTGLPCARRSARSCAGRDRV